MPRVLLVDDDIAEISAVKRVLARAGHQTLLATNGADALAAVGRATPAALVVASTCEGGEALRRLAEDGVAGALPLLVLGETSAAPEGAAQLARPVDPGQLAERLAAALGGAPAPAREVAPAPLVDRRAAADALRARAEELRRGAVTSALPAAGPPPPQRSPAQAPAPQRRRAQPAPPPAPEPELPPPAQELPAPSDEHETPVSFGDDGAGGDAMGLGLGLGAELGLDGAGEAALGFGEEPAHAAETPVAFGLDDGLGGHDPDAHVDADAALAALASPSQGAAAGLDLEQDPGLEAILRRAEQAEARAREDEEARRAEEETRRAEEAAAARAADAEARARAERQARESADRELQRLRRELEEARRAAEERARAVVEAARLEEEQSRRHAEAEEEQLRAAIESAREEMEALRKRSGAEEEQLRAAIRSAREEMETLRKRGEEDARRRAEAEAEAARLAQEAEEARGALEAERRAVEVEADRRAQEAERRARHAEERADEAERAAEAAVAGAAPPPLEAPVYRPPPADPEPDPAQESARRRVAALRGRERAPPSPPPARAAPLSAPPPDEPPRAPVRPPPPELRAGTLAELLPPRLLALAARAGLGGRLDFEGGATRSLYFEAGRVVGATSSAPAERVEEVALRLGLVTRDQHRIVAASAAPLATRRAAVLLLERGFLKPNELAPLVRRRTEEVVFGVFGDAGARFRWSAAEVPPDESTTLDRTTVQLAVEGVRRRWLAPELEGVLGGDATLLAPAGGGPSAADLGLPAEDRRVLALADGLRTLDEIVAGSPLDPLSTRQLLAALVLVGALVVRTFQAGRPAAAASAAIDLARVRDKLEQVRRADYFAVLGLGRLCTPHEVRDAFERLGAEFDPRRFQGVREEGLEDRLHEILRVVADARDVLADDRLRAEYLLGLGE